MIFSKVACIWADLNSYGCCVVEESRRKISIHTEEYEGIYKVIHLSKGELSAHNLHLELAHISKIRDKVFINHSILKELLNGKFCSLDYLSFNPSVSDAIGLKYLLGNNQLSIVGSDKKLRLVEEEFLIYNPQESSTPLIFSLVMALGELKPW